MGIARGDYVIRVNNRKVLNGVLEVAGLLDPADAGEVRARARVSSLRAIDKLDRLGEAGVRELLGRGRKDESGDFTEGAGLSEMQSGSMVHGLRDRQPEGADSRRITVEAADSRWCSGLGSTRIATVSTELAADRRAYSTRSGYGPDRIVIDPSVVRGLGYYTGPVFEAELTFEVTDDKGRPQRFGSVAGGGRYDDLVKRFTGQAVPATGVSIGVDRLLAALAAQRAACGGRRWPRGGDGDGSRPDGGLSGDGGGVAGGWHPRRGLSRQPEEFRQPAQVCRPAAEPGRGDRGRRREGAGVVQVKDLILGAKIAEGASLEEWRDRPSQREVPRGDLVATVRAMLAS